ncbi:hypothetical protein [Roseateles sp.]|uniref:hypothetical protein n=1 Tax=Roseateles sp. TaxID=1971397 RepID=UPI002F423CFB
MRDWIDAYLIRVRTAEFWLLLLCMIAVLATAGTIWNLPEEQLLAITMLIGAFAPILPVGRIKRPDEGPQMSLMYYDAPGVEALRPEIIALLEELALRGTGFKAREARLKRLKTTAVDAGMRETAANRLVRSVALGEIHRAMRLLLVYQQTGAFESKDLFRLLECIRRVDYDRPRRVLPLFLRILFLRVTFFRRMATLIASHKADGPGSGGH